VYLKNETPSHEGLALTTFREMLALFDNFKEDSSPSRLEVQDKWDALWGRVAMDALKQLNEEAED